MQDFSDLYFPHKDRIYDTVFLREYTGQGKPVFCYIVGNKTKEPIPKRVLQENKTNQFF